MFSQTVAGTSSTTYPKVHLSMCHRCLHFNWILVHFNRVQALKCFRNCLAPDNAEINVSTRQLFITLIHKLKLYFIAPRWCEARKNFSVFQHELSGWNWATRLAADVAPFRVNSNAMKWDTHNHTSLGYVLLRVCRDDESNIFSTDNRVRTNRDIFQHYVIISMGICTPKFPNQTIVSLRKLNRNTQGEQMRYT